MLLKKGTDFKILSFTCITLYTTMEIPNPLTLRLFFVTEDGRKRKFFWFQMVHEELYWGPSVKVSLFHQPKENYSDNTIKFEIPEEFDALPKITAKYSYHRSGRYHLKTSSNESKDEYSEVSDWKRKELITKPTRIFTLITKTISNYKTVHNKKDKQNEYSINFGCNEKDRLYFEFCLTPEGTFIFPEDYPEPYFFENKDFTRCITHSLNNRLILMIRFKLIGGFDWQEDKELMLVPNEI